MGPSQTPEPAGIPGGGAQAQKGGDKRDRATAQLGGSRNEPVRDTVAAVAQWRSPDRRPAVLAAWWLVKSPRQSCGLSAAPAQSPGSVTGAPGSQGHGNRFVPRPCLQMRPGLRGRGAPPKPEPEPWGSQHATLSPRAPAASQGGGHRAPGPGRCPAVMPTVGATGVQGARSKLTSPLRGQAGAPGRHSLPSKQRPQTVPSTSGVRAQTAAGRAGGEGGIPDKTPPAPRQPGGEGASGPAGWLRQFLFNRKRNDSCFILSRVALAGSGARRELCRGTLSTPALAVFRTFLHPLRRRELACRHLGQSLWWSGGGRGPRQVANLPGDHGTIRERAQS